MMPIFLIVLVHEGDKGTPQGSFQAPSQKQLWEESREKTRAPITSVVLLQSPLLPGCPPGHADS